MKDDGEKSRNRTTGKNQRAFKTNAGKRHRYEGADADTGKYRPDAEYDFAQRVYDTLTDSLNNDYALSQVENAYEMGSRCSILYDEAIRMCWDISRRLTGNELDNHPDLQLIMDNMTKIQKILCLKMFHYGVMFGRE